MDETLTQLGVGGILAMLILDKVFGFLKGAKAESTDSTSRHDLRNIRDFTIEQRQINRQLTDTQKMLANNSQEQTHLLGKIHEKQTNIAADIKKMANGRN